jgi:hypothetical protein
MTWLLELLSSALRGLARVAIDLRKTQEISVFSGFR